MRRARAPSGISLIELLFAVAIISMVMVLVAAIVQRLQSAQRRRELGRIAQQLAQDKLETLKSPLFPYLFVTAAQDAPDTGCLAGASAYDRNPEHYAPESLGRQGMRFQRQTCIEWVRPSTDGRLLHVETALSTGLKRIVVRVRWPGDHPSSEEELESVVSDPYGPIAVTLSSNTLTATALCTDGQQDPLPCGGRWFYLFDAAGNLQDMAASDRDGQIKFLHGPEGPCVVRPQLEVGEEADPAEFPVMLPWPEQVKEPPSFTLTRTQAVLHLNSNRENTLVAVAPGLASERPPDIQLRHDQATAVYGRVITDPETLDVEPGMYSVRCWARGIDGSLQVANPAGGLNALFVSGGSYAFECRF